MVGMGNDWKREVLGKRILLLSNLNGGKGLAEARSGEGDCGCVGKDWYRRRLSEDGKIPGR